MCVCVCVCVCVELLILAYGQSYNFFLEDMDIELEAIRSKEIGFKTNLGEHELGIVYFDNFINNLSTAPWGSSMDMSVF